MTELHGILCYYSYILGLVMDTGLRGTEKAEKCSKNSSTTHLQEYPE